MSLFYVNEYVFVFQTTANNFINNDASLLFRNA